VKYATPTATYQLQITEQHTTRTRLVQPTKAQRQLEAGNSHRAEWCTFGAISVCERLTSVGGQRFHESDLDRLHLRLLGAADVEGAMEWLNPYRAARGGAAT
jgi:hypothetical protein